MIVTSQDIDREIREQPLREANVRANLRAVFTAGPFGDSLKDEGADAE